MFFIDIFFKFFHLFLFLFLGFYFYRKYYKENLISQIEKEKSEIKNLIEKNNHTERAIENLEQQIVEQEKICSLMTEKIKFWKNAVEKLKQSEILDKEKSFEEIAKKRSSQLTNFYAFKTEEELLPEIIEQVKTELEEKYKNKENQNKYIENILKFIKENNGDPGKEIFPGKSK
ncbi:hypothetical protein M1446_03780 [Candidatus Dependentiae bacterium]|nr:hypothetical protein [Candidatus Dependentiae bacterium]